MKIIVTTLLLFFNVYLSFGQIQFESGYFISNDGQRTECLIKNYDWRIDPMEFEYKMLEDESSQMVTIAEVREFGIYDHSKYVRKDVKIDISISSRSSSENTFNPKWSLETLFLKALVQGEASLYSHSNKNNKFYFFSTKSTPILQLVYKEYKKSNTEIGVNKSFIQQLINYVNCEDIPDWSLERINYTKKDLVRHFVKYNKCMNSQYEVFTKKQQSNIFHLKLTPGINYASLSVSTEEDILADTKENADFDSEFNFRFGAEVEVTLPFNKNKWALLIEPTYQQYSAKKELTTQSATVDYKSIELPVGGRYYLHMKNTSKIFFNAFAIIDIPFNSTIDYERSRSDLDVNSGFNLALGVGYIKGKISAELRAYSNRNITNKYVLWDSKYRNISLIIGYRLF